MNIKPKKFNVKYLYHYTRKSNVDKIIRDGKFKSSDEYIFFTGSLKKCINTFESEMMSHKYYIDLDLKLKKRQYESKDEYAILKVPYVEDNNFYVFDFSSEDSIYNNSITHKGYYNFNKIEVLDFPKERNFQFNSLLAKLFISASLLTPCSVLADSWIESPNYDISWYNELNTSYNINNEAQLAGLAYLVNNTGINFEGKSINIQSDMSLINHDWELISNIFSGTICGAHRILLKNNNAELFASGNDYQFNYAYYYPAKLYSNDGNRHDIFLTSDETIDDFKIELISRGLLSRNGILVYNNNILNRGTITENNILQDGKLYVHEGSIFFRLDSGEYFGISCESGDTIGDVKNLIKNKKNIVPERMKIYYNNTELDNLKTIADYSILRGSFLSLKLKGEVKIENSNNGITTVDKSIADAGELINITTEPNNNYSIKDIRIYNDIDEDITSLVNYSDNKFTMPNYSVKVVTTYTVTSPQETNSISSSEITNPKTYDSIFSYITIGFVSLFSCIFLLLCKIFKRKYN